MARVIVNRKNPCGKCYFTDGHVENITHYTHYSEENIVFNTESGRYQFRMWAEPIEYETVRADESPVARQLLIPKHGFFMYTGNDAIRVGIDKIEIE